MTGLTPHQAKYFAHDLTRRAAGGMDRLADKSRKIGVDTKSRTLLKALKIGFEQMATTGAARKALIFTESRRTQDYQDNLMLD